MSLVRPGKLFRNCLTNYRFSGRLFKFLIVYKKEDVERLPMRKFIYINKLIYIIIYIWCYIIFMTVPLSKDAGNWLTSFLEISLPHRCFWHIFQLQICLILVSILRRWVVKIYNHHRIHVSLSTRSTYNVSLCLLSEYPSFRKRILENEKVGMQQL